jgi:hypothetical protein
VEAKRNFKSLILLHLERFKREVNPGFVSKLGSYGIAIEIDKYVELVSLRHLKSIHQFKFGSYV